MQPTIIPRSQHPISRSQLSPNALRVLYRLRDHGFIAYLVGGCVRDLLLGREPKDFDVVTNATPNQIKRLFRNCRLVGRRFRLAHLHFQDEIIEVATFRAKSPEPDEEECEVINLSADTPTQRRPPRHLTDEDGMVLRDNVFGSPEEDALRRDFTVNALFYNIADFSIIDYANGMEDLKQGVIRTIGTPNLRFTEDPVRMLRAIRFSVLLGFTIADEDFRTILKLAGTISRAAPARLFEEILKLLLCGEGSNAYQLLEKTGIWTALFPLFGDWLSCRTDGYAHSRLMHALDWADNRVQEGGSISPQLLLALVFGHYLEESARVMHQNGIPQQQSLDRVTAEFLGGLASTVRIPHKTGMLMRDILACQQRLHKLPPRQPQRMVAWPIFSDVLDYLTCVGKQIGTTKEIITWWQQYLASNPLPLDKTLPGSQVEKDGSRPNSRRRRRHRRKPA